MKTESLTEIIELIDDDTDAFGDRPRTGTMSDTGGPRLVGPIAAAALVGLIGFGVATSTSTGGAPKAAPVTSTSLMTVTTRPGPSTSSTIDPAVAFYAADPPPEFAVRYANVKRLDHAPFRGYAYELMSWTWGGNGVTFTPDATPEIHTAVDNGRTYVLADLPRPISTSGSLQISRAGLDVVVPFIDIDPGSDRTFAAYAFSEPGPYSVQIVGADNEVRASWPAS